MSQSESPSSKQGIDEGKLWAFLRSVLERGREIQQQYVGGSESYEHCSARVDEAARDLAEKFSAKFGAPDEPSTSLAEQLEWVKSVNAALLPYQERAVKAEKALRDIGACISGHDSTVCQDIAELIEKASLTVPPSVTYSQACALLRDYLDACLANPGRFADAESQAAYARTHKACTDAMGAIETRAAPTVQIVRSHLPTCACVQGEGFHPCTCGANE